MKGIIKTESEYQAALERLDEIFEAPENVKGGDKTELHLLLIEK